MCSSPSKRAYESTLEGSTILFALMEKYFPDDLYKLLHIEPWLQNCFNMNESKPEIE